MDYKPQIGETMLSKKTYNQVKKKLDQFRQQNDRDRLENPKSVPIDWKSSLMSMVEYTVRENRERFHKELAEAALESFVKQGLLVPYCGGCAFPQSEPLPTADDIEAQALANLQRLGML